MKDYYRTLEVHPKATTQEIKKAYRKLAVKYHPDKSNYEDADRLFAAINEAYRTLSDPDKRFVYDTALMNREPTLPESRNQANEQGNRPQNKTRTQRRYATSKPSTRELILPYVNYMRMAPFFYLFFCLLLVVDKVMPLETYQETAPQARYDFRGRLEFQANGNTLRMSNGKKISISLDDRIYLMDHPELITLRTFFFEKFVSAQTSNGNGHRISPYTSIYTNMVYLPISLLLLSLVQLYPKWRPEQLLNLSLITLFIFGMSLYSLFV